MISRTQAAEDANPTGVEDALLAGLAPADSSAVELGHAPGLTGEHSAPHLEAIPERLPQPHWNSYVAGAALGLVLLASFVVTGRGIGASGAVTRLGALAVQKAEVAFRGGTAHEKQTYARANAYTAQYINDSADPLDDFLVYLFVGLIAGGFTSGMLAARTRWTTELGPHTTVRRRLALAVLGGFISAFGTRLARGCTSGQALTGGATLAVGSWAFMIAVFVGGYAVARLHRKEWL